MDWGDTMMELLVYGLVVYFVLLFAFVGAFLLIGAVLKFIGNRK